MIPTLPLDPAECTLTALAVARRCGKTHPGTVRRWMTRGVELGGGRVVLASVRVGGMRKTSPAALGDFLAALNAGATLAPLVRTPAEMRRAAERALDRLRLRGLKV